jgi:hypothetical protein
MTENASTQCLYSIEQREILENTLKLAQEAIDIANLAKAKSVVAITAMPNVANMTNTIKTLQDEVSSLKDEMAIIRDQMAILMKERHETNDKLENHRSMVKDVMMERWRNMDSNDCLSGRGLYNFFEERQINYEPKLYRQALFKAVDLTIPYFDYEYDTVILKRKLSNIYHNLSCRLFFLAFEESANTSHEEIIKCLNSNVKYFKNKINEINVKKRKIDFDDKHGEPSIYVPDYECNQIIYEIMVELAKLYTNGQLKKNTSS